MEQTQVSLETQWVTEGVAAYHTGHQSRPFSDTDVGAYLASKALKVLEADIKAFAREKQFSSKVQQTIFMCVKPLDIATVSLKFLMDVAFGSIVGFKTSEFSSCTSSLSIKLGGLLVNHLNYVTFAKQQDKGYSHMVEFLDGKSKAYRRKTLAWWRKITETPVLKVDTATKAAIGYFCLKLAVESTGLFEVLPRLVHGKLTKSLFPSPQVVNTIMGKLPALSMMHPPALPMVCPPKPWTTYDDGGYLTIRLWCASVRDEDTLKSLMDSGALKPRLDVLNYLGSIPWEINREIVGLMEQAYNSNHRSVPMSDIGVVMPPRPWDSRSERKFLQDTRPEVIHEWKQKLAVIYTDFYSSRLVGQRLSFLRTLSIAKRFLSYDRIWFPHRIDYRGRYYPICSTLHQQGDEVARACIRFHKRTPMTPSSCPDGWRWYLIHGANLMGHDKVSFDERVSFIRQHHDAILSVARDPFANQMWCDADKPWVFLAWCLEYSRIVQGLQDYTQLPVARDGKCNGLQHLSMTIRDEGTAALVSLLPADAPSDIYSVVRQAVSDALPDDSYWKDKVTRKLVKRNTMTTPYNVTQRGMGEQLKEEIIQSLDTRMLSKEDKIHIVQLREVNYETIMGLLGRTASLMGWYNEVSHIYMKEGLKISWVLPDGFKVIQDIPRFIQKQVKLEDRTVSIRFREAIQKQDSTRNVHAMSPNVTHSMDATHMTMFIQHVIRTLGYDTPMAAIHDSFGLPAPQVTLIGSALVNTLVDLYQGFDIIESIRADYREQTGGKELPPCPERGTLDLEQVRQSLYAFA